MRSKQVRLDEFDAVDSTAEDDADDGTPDDRLDALTEHQREVYEAVVAGDQDVREYAEETGESVGAVAELAANAREKVEDD